MTERFDGVFHGNSESECIDFICAVRQHAMDNSKTKDNVWIADELFNAFRGKALKWYLRLPADVQGDWGRLQSALLTRWTTDDEVDDISAGVSSLAILPTAAAASPIACSPNPAPSRSSFRDPWTGEVGRVRAWPNGTAEVRYICKDCWKDGHWSGAFFSTTDAAKALKVRLIATAPTFYRLELVEHESGLSVLAAFNYSSNDWNTCYWGLLVGIDTPGLGSLKDRRTTYNGYDGWKKREVWTEKWQLGDNGVLKLCGPGDAAEDARFNLDTACGIKGSLLLAGPRTQFSLGLVEANLKFEPLDN